jgi:dihydrolipoamide dehydrogenase
MPSYGAINLHPNSHHPLALHATNWDVICIGSGWAGRVVATRVAKAGHKALVIESELVGGDCPFWACIPSKVLLRPQEALDEVRGVPSLSSLVKGDKIDAKAAFATRDAFTSNWDDQKILVPFVEAEGACIVRGRGRLIGEKQVRIDATDGSSITLAAKHAIVISTGSSPIIPDIPGLTEAKPWTPRHATSSSTVPGRLVVLGAGAVGCEMATAYASFGSKVTLVSDSAEILPKLPREAGKLVRQSLTNRGASIHLRTEIVRVSREVDNTVIVGLSNGQDLHADEILVATGRKPNSKDIGLEACNLPNDGKYIPVDEFLRVKSVSGNWLFAAGDVNGRHPLTHGSKYHGRAIATDILAKIKGTEAPGGWPRSLAAADKVALPQVIFTNPVVASVGLTEDTANEAGVSVRAISATTQTLGGRIRNTAVDEGWAQWIVENGTDKLVGATLVGKGVEDLIHASTVAIVGEMTLDRLAHAVPCFPTMSEVYLNLLEAAGI